MPQRPPVNRIGETRRRSLLGDQTGEVSPLELFFVTLAGLVALAVGNETAIERPLETSGAASAVALHAGPVLYLAAQTWCLHALRGIWSWPRLAAIALLILTVPATATTPALVGSALVAAILIAAVVTSGLAARSVPNPDEGAPMTVWLITGASRGFGREIAREALDRGDQVAASARTPRDLAGVLPDAGGRLLTVALDVTDPASIEKAVQQTLDRFGAIDVLVNNAGRGLLGAVEEVDDAEARAVFDINVFGLMAVTRAVLPGMRARRSGLVINMSSSGGFNGRTGWGVYSATKFAVEGLSEALRQELAPLGIQVTAIEPGGFRTDALDPASLTEATRRIPDYDDTAGAIRTRTAETNHNQPGDPAKAARAIVDLATTEQVPERLQLGPDCFQAVTDKLQRVAAEQRHWQAVSTSTDF